MEWLETNGIGGFASSTPTGLNTRRYHGENTAWIEYTLEDAGPGCSLEIRPLVASRDYHSTTHANDALDSSIRTTGSHRSPRTWNAANSLRS